MSLCSTLHVSKDEVVADNGVVAANHPLAAEAGLEMLRQGGNAIDAAVAAGFVGAVVEPMMTSIGGCGYMLVHLAGEAKTLVVDFGPRAPKAATPDMYQVEGSAIEDIGLQNVRFSENIYGYRSVTVPGSVAGFCLAHERYGSLPLEQVLEPAIHHAEQGFEVDWYTAVTIADEMGLIVRYQALASILLKRGLPPKIGDRLVQRDLGQTLRCIANEGRDAFYKGEVAAAIGEDMKAKGGLLSRDDLEAYQARVSEPVRVSYRGYDVLGVPAANGGTTALETLAILDNFDFASLGHNSVEALHLFIEAARHAFADRYYYLGDPEQVPVPMKGLLSPEYGASLAKIIDRERAGLEEGEIQPWLAYAEKAIHDPWEFDDTPKPEKPFQFSGPTSPSSTTHLGVVDRERNMVSCTHTMANTFGSRVACPGTGIVFADGMLWFNPVPGRANSIAGSKRPLVNMGPLMALREGRPFLSIGAPGGRKIINAVSQVVMNVVDYGLGVQEAIAVPRIDCSGVETLFHPDMDGAVIEGLRARGHRMVLGKEDYAQHSFARPVGVLVHPETGRLHGGADVLRRAQARGY
ncbi:MAG: gamma-glutamyltransferase [Dehalococcoidia bacterium]